MNMIEKFEAVKAGKYENLSVKDALAVHETIYQEWLKENKFRDEPAIRMAFDAGWALGAVMAIEKYSAEILSAMPIVGGAQ